MVESGKVVRGSIRRPARCRSYPHRVTMSVVILFGTVVSTVTSHLIPERILPRLLQTVVYVDSATGNIYNASLPDIDYSNFFDDENISFDQPATKLISLPQLIITLQLAGPSSESLIKVSSDLDHILENYLFQQVSNKTNDSSTYISSVSLEIDPSVSRLSRYLYMRRVTQTSSIAFQANGNVTLVSSSNVFQTDEVLSQTVNTAVESLFSDGSTLLAYITSHASTATLMSIHGVSTAINGHDYSSTVVDSISHSSVTPKRILSQIFGYALIGVAGLTIFGWLYFFYLRYKSQRNDSGLCKKSFNGNRETTPTTTGASDSFYRAPPSKCSNSKARLSLSMETSHEDSSYDDSSEREDSLFGDRDDDSFAMKLRKAVLIDRQSHNLDIDPPKASKRVSLNPVIPTIKPPKHAISSKRPKAENKLQDIEIPDPVDLELQSDYGLSWRDQTNPISYPQFNPFDDPITQRTYVRPSMESVNFVFKPRSTDVTDRSIPIEEYKAAVDAVARPSAQLSIKSQAYEKDSQLNRDAVLSKLRTLIQKFDDVDLNELENRGSPPIQGTEVVPKSDHDTGPQTASANGQNYEETSVNRLGINPINKTCRPPSSIVMKRNYANIVSPDPKSSPLRDHRASLVRPKSPIYASTPPHDRGLRPAMASINYAFVPGHAK